MEEMGGIKDGGEELTVQDALAAVLSLKPDSGEVAIERAIDAFIVDYIKSDDTPNEKKRMLAALDARASAYDRIPNRKARRSELGMNLASEMREAITNLRNYMNAPLATRKLSDHFSPQVVKLIEGEK